MSREKELKRLLKKFGRAECTNNEKILLQKWFDIIGDNRSEYELAEQDRIRMLADFTRSQTFREKKVLRNIIVAAACLTGILFGSVHFFKSDSRTESAIAKVFNIETGTGEIKKAFLPDSSLIWLNAKTRIEFEEDFSRNRTIKLDGEAYFDVRTDNDHPFRVLTSDDLQTTVLGTTFNISSYEKSSESNITVVTGKVQVEQKNKAGKIGILSPNESIIYNHQIQTYEKKHIDAHSMIGWTSGNWKLKSNGVHDLSLVMENYFGIRLLINKPGIDSSNIDMNFSNKQKPEEIITVFGLLTGCSHKWIDQHTVELY